MESAIIKTLGAFATAVIIAFLAYMQGRWSKEKEIVYSKKIDLYTNLVTELLEFVSLCAPNNKRTIEDYKIVMVAFSELQNSFYKASLFMPDVLHRDIQAKFTPANDRLQKIHTAFIRLHKVKNGANEKELGVSSFKEFKKQTMDAMTDIKELPGPFLPLIESAHSITTMLKKDLGISKIGSSFYAKKA